MSLPIPRHGYRIASLGSDPSASASPGAARGAYLVWTPRIVVPVLAGLFACGCQREEIVAYDAPKDSPPPRPSASSPHGNMPGPMPDMPPRPGLRWKELPEGWTSRGASGMRAATFEIAAPDNAQADLSVIPLPGTGGTELDLVNLWRGQLKLPAIAEADLPSHTDETTVGGQSIRLFTIVGSSPSDAAAAGNQILVAALRKEGYTWFFKLGGPAAAVAASRESLKSFLGGIEITPPGAGPAMAAAPPFASGGASSSSAPTPSGSLQPKWDVPPDWKTEPPTEMIHSKWSVAGSGGGSAIVTVSVFPGETGGMTANLNRWRSQVGLKPAPETELTAAVDNLDVMGGKATLVDYAGSSPESGDPNRIVAAVVRREGFSVFYKLLGAPAAVEAHREAFVKLVQTARYSRGS